MDIKFVIVMRVVLCVWIFCTTAIFISAQSNMESNTARLHQDNGKIGCDLHEEYQLVESRGVANFVTLLNKMGKCGYRLMEVTKYPLNPSQPFSETVLVGMLKLHKERHVEYDWFEANTPGEAQTRINLRATNGFSLLKVLPFAQGLASSPSIEESQENDISKLFKKAFDPLTYSIGAIYLMEKEKGGFGTKEYRVIVGVFGNSRNATRELKADLVEKVGQGFRPVAMNPFKIANRYAVSILLAREMSSAHKSGSEQFEIVISESGFEKNINNHAKSGYKIIFFGSLGAQRYSLLARDGDNSFQYSWVDSISLTKLLKFADQKKIGITHNSSGFSIFVSDYSESKMVFEADLRQKCGGSEMRVLNFSEIEPTHSEVRPISKDFEQLLAAGFVLKTLFFSKAIYGFLERPTPCISTTNAGL